MPMLFVRRALLCAPAAALLFAWARSAHAQSLAGLSQLDASKGLKAALEQGAAAAVRLLGQPDGFLANPKVHIPLPGHLRDAAKLMATLGMKRQVQELETAMNRAAEAAVPQAGKLLGDAVRSITVVDAKRILTGGETAVTEFFAGKTREPLSDTSAFSSWFFSSSVSLRGRRPRPLVRFVCRS